jgi:hypothetical protein
MIFEEDYYSSWLGSSVPLHGKKQEVVSKEKKNITKKTHYFVHRHEHIITQ